MSPRPARAGAEWVHVRPLRQPTARPGKPAQRPSCALIPQQAVPRSRSSAAPLAGLKLVRPRPRRTARRGGRSSLTPPARRHTAAAARKSHNHSPTPTRRPTPQVTGPNQHAPLTTEVPMGAATRPSTTQSDETLLHGMQKHLAEFPEEVVSVGSREVPEFRRANLRIGPVLCLADDRSHRVRVSLDRLKPVLDAQLNCVRSRGADTPRH